MKEVNSLRVRYHGQTVGTLAQALDGRIAFQYADEWLETGFSISPRSLPLEKGVFLPRTDVFEGLFGVFADSLPDGWGRLLVDRLLLSRKISPMQANPISRLGIVGSTGMGALEYVPELWQLNVTEQKDFDYLAQECKKILSEEETENLDLLFQIGGSSGGARLKALLTIDQEAWIVKFPSSCDRQSIGEEEYRYMLCAGKCGIYVPKVRLFPSEVSAGYFGAQRFDRAAGEKVHMLTVSGFLETSHRIPNLDYHDLMKVTYLLTKDSSQMEEMYRRMCFNVFAHNRDDHSKNFSFLYEEAERRWKLTPVYDLTYSSSIGGEHATCIDGNGRNPGICELTAVGIRAGIPKKKAVRIAEDIQEIVKEELEDILLDYR